MSRHEHPRPTPTPEEAEAIRQRAIEAEEDKTATVRDAYPFGFGAQGRTAGLPMVRREDVGQAALTDQPRPAEEGR